MRYALFVIVAGASFLMSVILGVPYPYVLSLVNLVLVILALEVMGGVINLLKNAKVTRRPDDIQRDGRESQ
jgi:hypothetical protein